MGVTAALEHWEPWQFGAALSGWKRANTPPGKPKPPSDDDFRQAIAATMH